MQRFILLALLICLAFSSSQLVTSSICAGQADALANCEESQRAELVWPEEVVQYTFSLLVLLGLPLLASPASGKRLRHLHESVREAIAAIQTPPPRLV